MKKWKTPELLNVGIETTKEDGPGACEKEGFNTSEVDTKYLPCKHRCKNCRSCASAGWHIGQVICGKCSCSVVSGS